MPAPNPADVDVLLVLLARGATRAAIQQKLYELDLDTPVAAAALAEARKQLVVAAAVAKDEALGAAITRVAELHRLALQDGDIRAAIAAAKEHSKLLGLYQPNREIAPPDDGDRQESAELAAIAAHLRPLKLVPDAAPLAEAARVAAERILSLPNTHEDRR